MDPSSPASSPFGSTTTQATPGSPLDTAPATASEQITPTSESSPQIPSTAGKTKKEAQFAKDMPPLNISGSPGIATPKTTNSNSNYFENLEEGKKAIQSLNKPGFVFLTNPVDEDNQRIERILGLSQFRDILGNMVFIKLDVDKDPKMLSHYGIYKTPSVVLYDSKGLMRKKIQSVSDMSYLLQEMRNLK
jgi:hypothetical protein